MPRHALSILVLPVLFAAWDSPLLGAAVEAHVVTADLRSFQASAPAMGRLLLRDTNGVEGDSLEIRELRVHVRASGPVALTEIEQTFYNPTGRQAEGTFYFAVPPGASLCRLAMYVDGVLVEGELVERDQARVIYESIVRRMRDPALMEWQDGSVFKTRIFPIPAQGPKRILISYTQLVPTRYGQRQYVYPLVGKTTQAVSIGRFEWTAEIDGVTEQLPVRVPAWPDAKVTNASGQATVRIERNGLQARNDVAVAWSPLRVGPIEAYPYRRMGDDGYVLLSYLPGAGSMTAAARTGRDVVLLFDTSLSRRPDDYRVQLTIAREILRDIGDDDRFALISFDVAPRLHTKGFVGGTEADRAISELERLAPLGATNLGKALKAVGQLLDESRPRGLPDLVILSDGTATLGETDAGRLLEQVDELLDAHPARIHGVTTGVACDRRFLQGVSRRSGGLFRTISASEDYQSAIGDLLFDLQGVVLPLPRLECTGVTVRDLLPREMDAVVEGEECFLLGRYDETGTLHVVFRHPDGSAVSQDVELMGDDRRYGYVPRLWAREELDALLNEPQLEDARAKIIELSQTYTLITPYTSFLVLENEQAYTQFGVARRLRQPIWGAGGLKSGPPPEELTRAPVRRVPSATRLSEPAPGPVPEVAPVQPVEKPFLARFNPARLQSYRSDSRVLSTALNVLSLETYYRYLPMYHDDLSSDNRPPASVMPVAPEPLRPLGGVGGSVQPEQVVPGRSRTLPMVQSERALGPESSQTRPLDVEIPQPSEVSEDAIQDIPLGGIGFAASIGIGGGGSGSFGHRGGGGRRRLVARGGGSRETESAVDNGLRWLAIHQHPDGSWDGTIEDNSLALLSFLGAGHTERVGQHKDSVRRSVAWLISKLRNDGRIGEEAYTQALITAALSEAAGMGHRPDTVKAAQASVDHLCTMAEWADARAPDPIESTWVLLALKSAKIAGLNVPIGAFERVIHYLDRLQDAQGFIRRPGGDVDLLATGCAALCRQFLGWKKSDPLLVGPAQKLDEQVVGTDLNRPDGLYLRYFGTLVTFQQGGDIWKRWNDWNKRVLSETQRRDQDDDGSWDPTGIWTRGRTTDGAFGEQRRHALAQAFEAAVARPSDEPALMALTEALAYADDLTLLGEMLQRTDLHTNIRVLLYLRQGMVQEELGLHTGASQAYVVAYELSGASDRILPWCVRALRMTEQPEKALELLLSDLRENKEATHWEIQAAAELFHEVNRPQREVGDVIAETFAPSLSLRLDLFEAAAEHAGRREEWLEAADLYGRAYRDSGNRPDYFSPYVNALYRAGCRDTVVDVYRQAFQDSGRSVALFEPYVCAVIEAGRWAEAAEALAGALRAGYRTPNVFRSLGQVYGRLGVQRDEYLRAATCELEAFPGEPEVHDRVASLLLDFGDLQGVLEQQLISARLGRFDLDVFKRLIEKALLAGEYQTAWTAIDTIAKRDLRLLFEWEDSTGQISEWLNQCKDPMKVASFRKRLQETFLRRDLEIRVAWNVSGRDVDLHVTEPDGSECSFEKVRTSSGGFLQRDEQVGPATERYVLLKAKPGLYRVDVVLFNGEGPVDVRVEVIQYRFTDRERRKMLKARCLQAKQAYPVLTVEVSE